MVDTGVSKTPVERHAGSSPALGSFVKFIGNDIVCVGAQRWRVGTAVTPWPSGRIGSNPMQRNNDL